MASFEQFLASFDSETKGFQFEYFVKWFLINDPEWSTQVDQVWMWNEYPERWGRDCGIDLIFKHVNGEIWAVQAKCYVPEYSITKSDVDTFLSESNRAGIDKRLLIATTDKLGANAKQVCHAQEKAVTLFLYSDFEQAAIEYPNHISNIHSAKRKERPFPRAHQLKAIDDVELAFKDADRGQLIMACGTGKTFTTFWIKERLSSQTTLVLLPSLSLLSQTLREWTFASHKPFYALCVCSDETVGKKSGDDSIIGSVQDVSFPTTSDAQDVCKFLKVDGDKVVFATYQSSPVIAEAQEGYDVPIFDLVIADEAHRCTGETGNAFSTVLDQSKIKAKKRLFATATPRTYSANLKKNASERGVEVTDMDDVEVFGSVFHALTFGEAIEAELLTDYQVVIIGVDEPMVAQWIENRALLQTEAGGEVVDAKSLASQIGLIKAIQDYDLKRMISFHSRVKGAEAFASKINDTIALVSEEHRPKGIIWAGSVSGKMPAHQRRLKLDQLKKLIGSDRGLLSNARCLSEGVDVPSLDGVAFIDPKSSQVDIVQAVGRAIRLSEDKRLGSIILPVFIEDGKDVESSLQASHFKPVWNVLNALKSHDEVLSFELNQYRTDLGKHAGTSVISRSIPKVVIDLPQTIDTSFANALKTQLVEQTTSSWNFWFGLLESYVEREGHAKVSKSYKTESGYRLGQWVVVQRTKRCQLTHQQRLQLEMLNGWSWDSRDAAWEEGFSHLCLYIEENGHAKIPQSFITADEYRLGKWVNAQRMKRKTLTLERASKLDSLEEWIWDIKAYSWEEGYEALLQYVDQNGHANIGDRYRTLDGYGLGNWVKVQRKNRDTLTSEYISRLEALDGWVWNVLEAAWEEGFAHLVIYVEREGHARVPSGYKTKDGYRLGQWVGVQRSRKGKLSPERKLKLEALIGWVWNTLDAAWEEGFSYLTQYVEQTGTANVPSAFNVEGGYKLGKWVQVQRRKRKALTTEQELKLESLDGWLWSTRNNSGVRSKKVWEKRYLNLCEFVEQNGHAKVPDNYTINDGYGLGSWVGQQRSNRNNLIPEQVLKLEALSGWVWNIADEKWEEGFLHLVEYIKQHQNALVSKDYKISDGYNLGLWVQAQRGNKKNLDLDKISRLEALEGWVWNMREKQWDIGFSHLLEYVDQAGSAYVTDRYKAPDGYGLGNWVKAQRRNREKLTLKQIAKLESLMDWVWSIKDAAWEQGISHIREYLEKERHAMIPQSYVTEDGFRLGQWVSVQRNNRENLTLEQKSRLEALNGWVWSALDASWEEGFSHLAAFVECEGHAKVTWTYSSDDGYKLGSWVGRQRQNRDKLALDRVSRLDSLGFIWKTDN